MISATEPHVVVVFTKCSWKCEHFDFVLLRCTWCCGDLSHSRQFSTVKRPFSDDFLWNFFGKDFVWIWSVSLTQAMSISPGEHNVSSVSHLIRICESFMWTKWMNLHEENCVQVCNGTIWRSFSLSFESRSFEINSHLIRFCRMHCGAEKRL